MTDSGLRTMTTGYGISFSLGAVSLPLVGIGLGALLIERAGGDPYSALQGIGLTCFVGAFLLGYVMRLLLWRRTSPALRSAVRTGLSLVFVALILASICAVALTVTAKSSGSPSWPAWFVGLAALCQIGSLLWLVRFRHEH